MRTWIADNARRHGHKIFVHSIDQNKAITYAQLYEITNRLSGFLAQSGIAPNDRVALLADNSIEHLIIYFGVMAHGATICTLHVEMNGADLADTLGGLRPVMVFYERRVGVEQLAGHDRETWKELGEWQPNGGTGFFAALASCDADAAPPRADRSDDACIYFTSGTTAKPKGVVLTFGELLDNVAPTAEAFGMTPADTILDFRSYNWASAQILSGLAPLSKGATVAMARRFSQSRFFGWLDAYKATIAAGNPTILKMLEKRTDLPLTANLSSLRFITSSSAPLMIEDLGRFEEKFDIPIAQGYGTSETGWIAGSNESTRRPGSVGRPLAYHKLKIVDEHG
ncbi:MAG: class I adenylate-forming enzyme family protein, partial [Alphaproteobacteria bacterium]|nr:class I adenylate-forming enzyme family protein [Alphaproteobacteria bacterium]